MEKWEYRVLHLGRRVVNLASDYVTGTLNEQGHEGWELVSIIERDPDAYAVFKRPRRRGLLG